VKSKFISVGYRRKIIANLFTVAPMVKPFFRRALAAEIARWPLIL
jgi:hypothetical protein